MDKKKKIIIISSVVALILVIGLAIFLLTRDGKKDDDKPTPTPTPVIAKESFIISFDTDGGEELEDLKVEKGKEFILPTPKKDGYEFDGWYLDDKAVDSSYEFTEDVTLKAKWKDKTLKVIFDSKGGSNVKTMIFTCSNGAATLKNLPTPTKDFYEFRTWEDKNAKPILNGASIICDGDLKLYAVWEYDGPVANPEQNNETTTTPTKEKKWTCSDGYDLNESTKKCTITKNPSYYCETGKESNGTGSKVCYSWAGNPTSTTCKNNGTYIVRDHADDLCGYEELPSYTGSYQYCTQNGGTLASNNHCYKRLELATESILNHTCPGTSAYRTSAELGNQANSGCYNLSQRTYGCKLLGDDYKYNYERGKCIKTIDATYK